MLIPRSDTILSGAQYILTTQSRTYLQSKSSLQIKINIFTQSRKKKRINNFIDREKHHKQT